MFWRKISYRIIVIFFVNSCTNINGQYCADPSEYESNQANEYYNSFGTYGINLSRNEARKIFGCKYHVGDFVYVYPTLWGKKFILVRYGKAVTYADE